MELIDTTDYKNAVERGKLVSVLQGHVVPWLYVGRDTRHEIYRIVPGENGLLPTLAKSPTELQHVSKNVLGVIFESTRKGKRKIDEMETGVSAIANRGFVCHQIGALEYWGVDEPEKFGSHVDDGKGPWLSIEFCVVMRFDHITGAAEGLYTIFDMEPEDELSGRRSLRGDHLSYLWGCLPGNSQPCFIGKIANNIKELGLSKIVKLEDTTYYPITLVRVPKTDKDEIVWQKDPS